ncbi:MAG: type I secretion system permease/ATPase, partial [Sphaerospermopsis kisseleviana]
AASKEVVVVCWNSSLWEKFSHPQIDEFWHGKGGREQVTGDSENREKEEISTALTTSYLSLPSSSKSVISDYPSNYPFVVSENTAAACLTMVAQYLNNSVQLEWVQRQLRG